MTIEPYNYNDEPSGRSETLTQALDKCERLEKQLEVAVEALKDIYEWADDECFNATNIAEKALKQIKEIENERK